MATLLVITPPAAPSTVAVRNAYGTVTIITRGTCSGSVPTLMPRYRVGPEKTESAIGVTVPNNTEKIPFDKVTVRDSLQSATPPLDTS